ncbi:MAG: acyltransferase [Sphingobacteriaceae bacterium]|nr:MAG: acyltransferase [Sphingobacteriaceae bacterium]
MTQSNFIHSIRWISAVLVVMNHLRSLLFKDYLEVSNPKGLLIKFFYLITSLGHSAVIFFFVLSGYLIGRSVINQINYKVFNFKDYLLNRVSRIYAVLIVALLFTWFFDSIGGFYDANEIYSNRVGFATLNFSVVQHSTIIHFLASLLMMQSILLPPFGSNGPLWSLSFEFWYYVMFPVCLLIITNFFKDKKLLFLNILILSALLIFLPITIKTYYLIWLLGLIPLYLKLASKAWKFILPALLVSTLLAQRYNYFRIDGFYYDFIVASVFACWLATFIDLKDRSNLYSFNKALSGFSYSLYLLHFPFILCILTVIQRYKSIGIKMNPSPVSFSLFCILLLFTLLFAYSVSIITEQKTSSFRNFLKQKLS